MQSLIQRVHGPTSGLRALLLALTTLVVVSACDREDPLPTGPPTATSAGRRATIVGADVTVLPINAVAINESGQVAGTRVTGTGDVHPFLWTPGGPLQDLGTLGGSYGVAYDINDVGQVVGMSYTAGDVAQHAFLWTPGQGMQDLGTLGGQWSFARAINDRGQIVGDAFLANGGRHAFLWTPGIGMQDLGTLGGDRIASIAHDINNAGQVVGESFHPAVGEMGSRAFLWTSGEGMRDLGSLGLPGSIANAINDLGQVVGRSWTALGPYHAFVWTASAGMQDLGVLVTAGMNSVATGINNAGQVVGSSNTDADHGNHAFVWTAATGMEDLFPTTGMSGANDINDRQQVVGGNILATLRLALPNRAPVANVAGPYAGGEGSVITLGFSATDADGDALTYSWDLGDGTTGSGVTPPISHVYADNGAYAVSLTVSDGKGGVDTKTATATIANVAPVIVSGGLTGPPTPIRLVDGRAGASITLAFSDPAGANDTYRAEIACGNGTTLAAAGIASPYTAMCAYTSAGLYTVSVTVADDDGGTSTAAVYRYVVVYDPDGPFVTGAGFYGISGNGNRKAHFTFSARFASGQAMPNGTVKFWIPGSRLDFESNTIEMLVVAGTRAQFWGTGTLNGAAARFRITAVDGQPASGRDTDAIRIELWDAGGALVYDNHPGAARDAPITQEIEGGSVRIHKE